ncbi:hypothetical protein EON62_06090 [archaeon]|nr:MAG: hypothetical protein EON62_06090 [archaeon]
MCELQVDDSGHRDVIWEMNGENRIVRVADAAAGGKVKSRVKAVKSNPLEVGAPMPGVVVDVRAVVGKTVKKGEALAVLSAMKMETVVGSPRDGVVQSVNVAVGETLEAGDLIVTFA